MLEQLRHYQAKVAQTFSSYKGGHPSRDPEVKERKKKTWLTTLGVENPSHNSQVREKQVINSSKRKTIRLFGRTFKNLQGAEPAALQWLLEEHPEWVDEIKTGSNVGSFDYKLKGKSHKYFPDLKVRDLIIEVKSTYTFGLSERDWNARNKREVLKAKLKAVERAGYRPRVLLETKYGWVIIRGADFDTQEVRNLL